MRQPRFLALAVAVAVPAALAGCGPTSTSSSSKSFTGPAKDVAQTVSDLGSAAGKRDAKTICTEILAPSLEQRLSRGSSSCQSVISDQLKDADLSTMDTRSVKVTGNRATAVVRSQFFGHDADRTLTFERGAGGAWRITGIQP